MLPFAAPAFVVGVGAAGAAIVSLADATSPSQVRWAATGVAIVWGIAGLLIGLRRRSEPLGLIVAAVAACAAAVLAGSARTGTDNGRVRDVATGLLVAVLFHLAVGLPEGRLGSRPRRILVALGYVAAIVVGLGRERDRCRDRRPDDRDGRACSWSSRSVSTPTGAARRVRSSARGCNGPAGVSWSPR